MDKLVNEKNNRQVANWLLLGVIMIIIQVVLGGVTRLTESGLSITEWKPITGALPPMNTADWQTEFEKYRTTDQFKYVHQDFSMSDFKFIYFWEWSHRQWARLMGLVFIIGFIYFLIRRKFSREMIFPMALLFLLGAAQGFIGWVMVKSGLVAEKYFVGHIELTSHFIAALLLLAYTLWFALRLHPSVKEKIYHSSIKNLLVLIFIVLFFQLIYGGFMAGLHAAQSAPTWPDINRQFIPATISELTPVSKNFIDNRLTVQFIHRGLGYTLLILVLWFFISSKTVQSNRFFKALRTALITLTIVQVLLGISALLKATDNNYFIWLGVSHQFTAMLMTMTLVALMFVVRRNKLT